MSFSKPSVIKSVDKHFIHHHNHDALPHFPVRSPRKSPVFGSVREMAVSDSRNSSFLAHIANGPSSCPSGCKYCATMASLDVAAFYWSYMAMYGAPADPSVVVPPSPSLSMSSSCSSADSDGGTRSPAESLCSNGESQPPSPSTSVSSGEYKECCTSSNGPKYQCRVCQKTYSHPRLLNRHVQSHTAYKKHHCPRCGKGFNDAFDLKRHIRTHTGVKPFKCSMCDKSFTQRCSLEAHSTRVHSLAHEFAFRERRPKIYVCEDCGITFLENSKFRKHAKEHLAKYNNDATTH